MPRGVWRRTEEYKKSMCDKFKGRKIINGHWAKRSENGMSGKNFLHYAIESLEKRKEKGDLDADMVNKMVNGLKSLGEEIARAFDEAYEKAHKPIESLWYLKIVALKGEEKKVYESLNKQIEQIRTEFPKVMITISLCKQQNNKK